MDPGVWKFFSPQTSVEYYAEFPCAYGNQELLQTLKNTYSNSANVLDGFRTGETPWGENFILVEELVIPAEAPTWLAPLPRTPDMLPAPNYPFNQVVPSNYSWTDYSLQEVSFTDPTPQTQVLMIRLIIIIVITMLDEIFRKYGAFVPLFLEPHLLLSLLLGVGKHPVKNQHG
ncbi:MAG TPA: hypothetical protein VN278_06940 [Methanosarcina sp.]|nr:hypothetical protein [Methanosarcina sp.]